MEPDLKELQQRELEILKQVVSLCDRHGIRYFLDAGTCLGAVRHQGFIPWDDDIDIGMCREDFDRFRAVAKTELPEHLVLYDYEQLHDSLYFFLKVHDDRTTFVEGIMRDFPELYTGVFIDIFCYDGYPAPGFQRKWLELRMSVLMRVNWLLRADDERNTWWPESGGPVTKLLRKMLRGRPGRVLAKVLRRMLPYNWASLRMEKIARRYDIRKQPYTVNRYVTPQKAIMASAYVTDTVRLPFEGQEMCVPVDYDGLLRAYYGDDYMTPLPENKREPRHPLAYYDMERSYREYQKRQ